MSNPPTEKNYQAMAEKESLIRRQFFRFFPIVSWLPKYKLSYLRFDLIAGIICGITILPQCLAAGSMTGVRPHNGLAATFLGQIIYIMMGTSKDASIGPSPIIAVITGEFNAAHNPLYDIADSTYTTILSFTIGIILTVWGIVQLSYLYNLFSIPVVSGFMAAAGFAVPCSQLRNFFGLPRNPMVPPGVLVKQVKNVFDNWEHIKPLDVAFGIPSLTYIVLIQRLPIFVDMIVVKCCKNKGPVASFLRKPKVARAIGLIAGTRNAVVFLVTTIVSYHLQTAYPAGTFRYTIVGNFKFGLPPLRVPRFYQVRNESAPFVPPNLVRGPGEIFEQLTIGFVVLPWVVALEMTMGLKGLSRKNGYKVDSMQEMVAVGVSNFAQSFIGAIPVTNAAPRMALMDGLKSKTPLASFFAGITTLIFIGVGSELFYYSPRPPIAAVIIGAGLNFIDFSIAKLMWKEYPKDVIVFTFTFITCFFYDMTYGLLTSFLLHLCIYLTPVVKMHLKVSRVPISIEKNDGNNALLIRLPAGMKFPSTDKFCDRTERAINSHSDATHIIIDCKLVTGTDYTGIQAFRRLLVMAIKHKKNLVFTNLNDTMRRKLEDIGLENFRCAASVDDAISEYNKMQWLAQQQLAIVEQLAASDNEAANGGVSREPMSEAERIKAEVEEDIKIEAIVQRRLSRQPNFYEDIPMGVGHTGDAMDDDDDDDDVNGSGDEHVVSASSTKASGSGHQQRHQQHPPTTKKSKRTTEGGGASKDDDDKVSVSTYQFVASDLSDAHRSSSAASSKAASRHGSGKQKAGSTGSFGRPPTPAAVAKFLRRFSREQQV